MPSPIRFGPTKSNQSNQSNLNSPPKIQIPLHYSTLLPCYPVREKYPCPVPAESSLSRNLLCPSSPCPSLSLTCNPDSEIKLEITFHPPTLEFENISPSRRVEPLWPGFLCQGRIRFIDHPRPSTSDAFACLFSGSPLVAIGDAKGCSIYNLRQMITAL